MRRIIEVVSDRDVTCVFHEPQFAPDLVRVVTESAEVTEAEIDPLGSDLAPGPDLYPALLTGMADSIASCGPGAPS